MTANSICRPWRIEIALQADADRDLLVHTIAAEKDLEPIGIKPGREFSGEADLLILDYGILQNQREQVAQLRADAYPVVLPALLLAPVQYVSPYAIKRELGHVVEDVLRLPTTGPEILSRVRNLLRLRDLSQAQLREHDLTRQILAGTTRALKTLNACNEVMLRESDQEGLISSVCRVITQSEGYDLAWVGFAEESAAASSPIDIFEAAGPVLKYTENLEVYGHDLPWNRAALNTTLSTGIAQVVSDLMADPRMTPWRSQIEAWGLESAIFLPLRCHAASHGILAVYSRHRNDFDNEERDLLERLANNLAFGLDKLWTHRESERQSQEIHYLAFHDSLTSLPNRRSLLHHLKQVAANDQSEHIAAILFIDLNDFKLLNDALGHSTGDEVLKRVAQRLQDTMRQDDLVGRQGGDEFIVIMVDRPRQPSRNEDDGVAQLARGAETLAVRIQESLRQPFEVQGYQHHLSASIGISLFPYFGSNAETVIDQADMAMYQAKATGSPHVFYSHTLGNDRQQRLSLESELYHAVKTNQFLLHYQPIWEISSGKIMGVEALIRWKNSDGHMVFPGAFIPLAEEIGLMDAIGDWVLETAARQLSAWHRAGVNIWMSVNLSVSQLQGKQSAMRIHNVVTAEGAKPDWLLLELTEDALMQASNDVTEAMQWLSKAGYHLSLDDFGQGHSSLARLQSFPLHTIKIDKLFVDPLEIDGAGKHIIGAITELGRRLSLKTVAEGVETETQNEQLGRIGCDFGQGFFLSAACPAEDIPNLVRQRQPKP